VVKTKHLFLAAIIFAGGILIVLHLSESEEKKVKKQFTLLSEVASKDSDESIIATAQKMQKIRTFFDKRCELKTHLDYLSGTFTPEEIVSHGTLGRAQFSKFSLRFSDLKVEFPEKGIARVTLTLRVSGILKNNEHVDEIHEVESALRKIEKKWLFSSFRVVEVLKR
jgi:hypothetical protein